MIGKIGNTALGGIQRSSQEMLRSASEISRAGKSGDQSDMTRAVVELKQHEHAAKANMKTLAVTEKLLGALLDVRA